LTKLSLKNIIGKKNEINLIVVSLIERLDAKVWVEDEKGNLILGAPSGQFQHEYFIEADEVIGVVRGDEKAKLIAEWLNYVIKKEGEKKKLGAEVLNLYQEINLIYNFSEKLAQNIDPFDICNITLTEAAHVIRSDNAVIVLRDEKTDKLSAIAVVADLFIDEEKFNEPQSIMHTLLLNGQSGILTDVAALKDEEFFSPQIQSIIYSPLKMNQLVMGAIILASSEQVQYTAADLKLLTTLALQSSAAIESALLYEKNIREAKESEEAMRLVYEVTGKFVPYEFIGSLGHNVITDVKLGDQAEKIVTVLFSDIRGYTTLSEKMTPEENFKFVCSFNERMGPAIRRHHGFINQYLGDAIMAIFPGNASDALAAAIEMQKEVQELNKDRITKKEMPIQIGVGMHTGSLIMGITGDADRMDATTISDTVNIASRLESLTKHYSANIILSDASLNQILQKNDFHLRYLGLVQLKGKNEAIHIHECFDCNTAKEVEQKLNTLNFFNEGVSLFLNKSFSEANIAFKKVLDVHPADATAKFFYGNTKKIVDNGAPENLPGVVEMQEK
jgi:adenylate cyclase